MDRPSFVIHREEAESAAKQVDISVVNLLPLLVNPAKPLARPPISKFPVVAVGSSGRIFVGVNVEFPGLPLHHSIHAEQFLVTNLLNSERNLRHFSVSAAPCGHCRLFLQEIRGAPEIRIIITDPNAFRDAAASEKEDDGEGDGYDGFVRLESILPHRFGPDDLLEKDVSLLLEPHDNRLTLSNGEICNGHTDSDRYADLKRTAVAAASRSYSPYSRCPLGVALVDCEGKVYGTWNRQRIIRVWVPYKWRWSISWLMVEAEGSRGSRSGAF